MTYKKTGDLKARARRFWRKEDTAKLAQTLVVSIKNRAFKKGLGIDDRPHKAYSTTPIFISDKSETGKRLAPKGGIRRATGVFYPGGYRQYKRQSEKSSAKVNLTLSGNLLRSIRIKRLRRFTAIIGMSGNAKDYGVFVDRARPFMGISKKDSEAVAATFRDKIKERLAGRRAAIISAGNTSRAY